MANSVVLKGSTNGISVIISEATDYNEIKNNVIEKFKVSEQFFKGATVAISFEGEQLKDEYQVDLLNAIVANTSIDVACLIDKTDGTVAYYNDILESMNKNASENSFDNTAATLVRHSVRNNDIIEESKALVIYGDVKENGLVTSNSDIIVLGKAYGTLKAGIPDNKDAVIYSEGFENAQLSIAGISIIHEDKESKSLFKKNKKKTIEGLVKAYLKDDEIHFEAALK